MEAFKKFHILIIFLLFFLILSGCTLIIQPYEKDNQNNRVKPTPQKYPPEKSGKPKQTPRNTGKTFTYTVKKGDTLWGISRRFNADIEEIAGLNRIKDASFIKTGQKLKIPGEGTNLSSGTTVKPLPKINKPNPVPKPSANAPGKFIWPIRGVSREKITSKYGKRLDPVLNVTKFHAGIDIDADLGDTILASASGEIAYTGTMSGYGKLVIIKHKGEWYTIYAHLNSIDVNKDERVSQGEKIGEAGRTGLATGVHLHFEIRQGKEHKNPLLFLP